MQQCKKHQKESGTYMYENVTGTKDIFIKKKNFKKKKKKKGEKKREGKKTNTLYIHVHHTH